MDPKAEVVVWDRLWDRWVKHVLTCSPRRSYPAPSSVQVAPFATHIAWHTEVSTSQGARLIYLGAEIRLHTYSEFQIASHGYRPGTKTSPRSRVDSMAQVAVGQVSRYAW